MVHLMGLLNWCCESKKNLIILCTILASLPQPTHQYPAVSRRSALEAGHVSFPEKTHVLRPLSSSTVVAPTSQSLKLTTVIPSASNLEKVETVKPLTVSTTAASSHVRREWIPGHVKHHAYIPAHARNVFVPAHPPGLSTAIVPTASHRYQFFEDDKYRSHYGGFGVGVDYGGQGAGHGFQVTV